MGYFVLKNKYRDYKYKDSKRRASISWHVIEADNEKQAMEIAKELQIGMPVGSDDIISQEIYPADGGVVARRKKGKGGIIWKTGMNL